MKKLLLLLAAITLPNFAQGVFPVTANRIVRGNGAPTAGSCGSAAAVGKVYIRQDAAAANSTFYTCANTASMTYAWELGGGAGCTTSGTGVQTGNGSGGCTNNSGVTITSNAISATGGFSSGSSPPSVTAGTGGVPFACGEGTVPSVGAGTGVDIMYCDSTVHQPLISNNNGSFFPFGIVPTFGALTDAATVTWAIGSSAFDNKTLTFTVHGGSRTLNITGPVNGGSYVLWLKQDATGGEGLTLGTGCTWKVSGGGAGAITPSTGASAIDVLTFTYDGTNCYANFNKNFT